MEIASNDGYLLEHFVERDISVVGVEPAANVAAVAQAKGIRTEVCFFGASSAENLVATYGRSDLIAANNVIAHVPDLHDFIAGVKVALKADGVATFEFPHLLRLIEQTQFDTIYHEHFSYFALAPLIRAFEQHGLAVFDVEGSPPMHGGSLRIFVAHAASRPRKDGVAAVLAEEMSNGLDRLETYATFQAQVDACRDEFLEFLERTGTQRKSIAGYGAPAKGNTLLNYCRVDASQIPFTVDRSPHKQGRFLPGSHIPILHPNAIYERRPDVLLVLAWNLSDEIRDEMREIGAWGGRFAVAIPRAKTLE